MLSQQQFIQYGKEGYNRVPVVREVLSDLDTPLSVYLKLANAPYSCLLESVEGGERFGRYSIIGLPAKKIIRFYGNQLEISENNSVIETRTVQDPFAEVEALRAAFKIPEIEGLPEFTGGLVGWFGFECIGYIEPHLKNTTKPNELNTPDILLMVQEELAVFDNLKGRLYLISHANPNENNAWETIQHRLDQLVQQLRNASVSYPEPINSNVLDEKDFISGFTQEGYIDAVKKCQEYIRAGDIFQVVLSQRMSVPFNARPVDVYRALRALNPSPYMYFLDVGDTQVVGSSPEILVRLKHGEVTVRPIAGTRPRGKTHEEDLALEVELLADPKERAEHLMLIDLGRNDAGRVSQAGSVEVGEQFVIERYSHVMHIVSEVTGKLQPNLTYADVLRATFPAGTVSGAPKIRALEIIQDLEPIQRNVYAGSIGYISWNGDADTAIAIRTAMIKDGRLHVQAGAGIVYDSDPQKEWEETMNKGRALFRAVAHAAKGL